MGGSSKWKVGGKVAARLRCVYMYTLRSRCGLPLSESTPTSIALESVSFRSAPQMRESSAARTSADSGGGGGGPRNIQPGWSKALSAPGKAAPHSRRVVAAALLRREPGRGAVGAVGA
eukprot:scaffold100391_cov56-Phaeocystis_antarctica.AAC.1